MDTKSVLIRTESSNKFDPCHAQLIVNRVVETLVNRLGHKNWDEEHFELIGKNLATICKTKHSAFWSFKKGKVRERFKNYIHKCLQIQGLVKQKLNKTNDNINVIKLPEIVIDDELSESLDWLKKNHQRGEIKSIIDHWVKTQESRNQWMSINKSKTVDFLYKDWPIIMNLKYGPDLILHDFEHMFPKLKADSIIDNNWEPFFDYIHGNYPCENHSKECKKILDWCELCTSTEGGKMVCQLIHLAHLFPLRGNGKVQPHSKDKGISIVNSTDSIVCHGKTVADIEVTKKKKIEEAGRAKLQPYVVAVNGNSLNEAPAFYVVMDEYTYPMKSAKNAVDLCFKMYHTLLTNYPPAARHVWRMIKIGVYKFKNLNFEDISYLKSFFEQLEDKFEVDRVTSP